MQNAVKDKINLGKGDSGNDRKSQIKRELDEIRNQQSDKKLDRGKVHEQLKVLQEGIQKKVRWPCCDCCSIPHAHERQIKDLNAAKAKAKFKSVEEADAHIR